MIILGTYSGSYIVYSRYMAKVIKTKKLNIQSVHMKPCYKSGQPRPILSAALCCGLASVTNAALLA